MPFGKANGELPYSTLNMIQKYFVKKCLPFILNLTTTSKARQFAFFNVI
jgi:hypothetical protein